jgi:hypothetical protein
LGLRFLVAFLAFLWHIIIVEKIINFIKRYFKSPIFWVRFSAYAIPLAFLLYVLYWNFLPFGYNKTFIINVGSPSDTSGEFYLEPSKDLSERKTAPSGATYRELNGMATAVFKPKAVLKNTKITVEVTGEGVSLIPPVIDFDPNSIKWDYNWNFTKSISKDLIGDSFYFDDATYFDGKSKLELPYSADMFENGPFSIYVEWTPKDDTSDFQEIVGHYNWELFQNKDSLIFQVGRMNDSSGPTYSILYPITKDFFDKKHSALAIYSPSENGYIDLFVDGDSAGRKYFGTDKIWENYGNKNLNFGKSNHGVASYFKGNLQQVNIAIKNILSNQSKTIFEVKNNNSINIPIISTVPSTLKQIKLNAVQK